MSAAIEVALSGGLGAFRLDAAFSAPARGVTGIFGPSGSGKTTLLRAIAGLARLEGRVALAGTLWQGDGQFVAPHRRGVGYVAQVPGLFDHLSVAGNLAYGDRRGPPPGPGDLDLASAAALLGIAHLLERAPRHLSGGERQRVAIGRALMSRPRLLLMDEPLSALDRANREAVLPYLQRLAGRGGAPILYVSHDLVEVDRLAGHLILLDAGRVTASGPLAAMQADPALPIAALPEAAVTLVARRLSHDAGFGLSRVAVPGATLWVPEAAPARGGTLKLRIAANDVSLARQAAQDSTILNILPARIRSAEAQPPHRRMVSLTLAGGKTGETDGVDGASPLLARITERSWANLGLAPGDRVFAQIKSVALDSGGG